MIFFKKFTIKSITKKLKSLQQARTHNQPSDEALHKEISLYFALIDIYASLNTTKNPFAPIMVNNCLRAAATLENSEAQYKLATNLIEEAKFRSNLEKDELFANPSNERRAKTLFEEALAYLISAENLGHILAQRLHGLCYINGWGVEADGKKGFDLVVASIEKEGSWDKVPQIFAEIGLNKPEFFSALSQHRSK